MSQSGEPIAAVVIPQVRGERFYGLDWFRAVATLLVVVLHAGIAHMLVPLPGLAWPTRDPHPSPVVDAIVWWIDGWIMPGFFLMSGFVAARLFARLGPSHFLHHRSHRLLGALAFGMVVILPLDLYVWLLGWVAEGRIDWRTFRSLKLGDEGRGVWGVGHLWFLQYLFLYSLAAWGWQRWTARYGAGRRIAALLAPVTTALSGSWWLPLLLAAPASLALWWAPDIVIGFRHSWWPLPANLAYYGPWFIGGWWLLGARERGVDIARGSVVRLVLASVLFALMLPLIHEHCRLESTGGTRISLVAMFSAFGGLSAFGWMGLSLAWLNRRPPQMVQFLVEASFWIYLSHHPVVGLAQVTLVGAPVAAFVKFSIVAAVSILLPLLTYQAFVRDRWIGTLLGGSRRKAAAATADPVHAAGDLRAA